MSDIFLARMLFDSHFDPHPGLPPFSKTENGGRRQANYEK